MNRIVPVVVFLLFMFLMYIKVSLTIYKERKNYNKGICPKCGGTFMIIHIYGNGDREYHCNNCNNTTWVTYDCVDREIE